MRTSSIITYSRGDILALRPDAHRSPDNGSNGTNGGQNLLDQDEVDDTFNQAFSSPFDQEGGEGKQTDLNPGAYRIVDEECDKKSHNFSLEKRADGLCQEVVVDEAAMLGEYGVGREESSPIRISRQAAVCLGLFQEFEGGYFMPSGIVLTKANKEPSIEEKLKNLVIFRDMFPDKSVVELKRALDEYGNDIMSAAKAIRMAGDSKTSVPSSVPLRPPKWTQYDPSEFPSLSGVGGDATESEKSDSEAAPAPPGPLKSTHSFKEAVVAEAQKRRDEAKEKEAQDSSLAGPDVRGSDIIKDGVARVISDEEACLPVRPSDTLQRLEDELRETLGKARATDAPSKDPTCSSSTNSAVAKTNTEDSPNIPETSEGKMRSSVSWSNACVSGFMWRMAEVFARNDKFNDGEVDAKEAECRNCNNSCSVSDAKAATGGKSASGEENSMSDDEAKTNHDDDEDDDDDDGKNESDRDGDSEHSGADKTDNDHADGSNDSDDPLASMFTAVFQSRQKPDVDNPPDVSTALSCLEQLVRDHGDEDVWVLTGAMIPRAILERFHADEDGEHRPTLVRTLRLFRRTLRFYLDSLKSTAQLWPRGASARKYASQSRPRRRRGYHITVDRNSERFCSPQALAWCYLAIGEPDEVLALMKSNDGFQGVEATYLRAVCYYYRAEFDQAMKLLQGVVAQSSGHVAGRLADLIDTITKLKSEAAGAYKSGDYSAAIRQFESLVQHDPTNRVLRTTVRCNIAAAELKRGRPEEAIAQCNRVLKYDPRNSRALYRRHQCHVFNKKWDGALRDINAAIRADPLNKSLLGARERCRQQKREDERGQSCDLYQLLGVSRDASQTEIKSAYRKLALLLHPDKNTGAPAADRKKTEDRFKDVADAYETLSDIEERELYDAELSEAAEVFAQRGVSRGRASYGNRTCRTCDAFAPKACVNGQCSRCCQGTNHCGYKRHKLRRGLCRRCKVQKAGAGCKYCGFCCRGCFRHPAGSSGARGRRSGNEPQSTTPLRPKPPSQREQRPPSPPPDEQPRRRNRRRVRVPPRPPTPPPSPPFRPSRSGPDGFDDEEESAPPNPTTFGLAMRDLLDESQTGGRFAELLDDATE